MVKDQVNGAALLQAIREGVNRAGRSYRRTTAVEPLVISGARLPFGEWLCRVR